jgi:hypothetical protein
MKAFNRRSAVLAAAVAALLSIGGCKTSRDNMPVGIATPEIEIRQLNNVPNFMNQMTGPISINFRVAIHNVAPEAIVLYQLRLESLGDGGGFSLQPTERPFNKNIEPNAISTVEMWAPANADDTLLGANGPVTLRTIAFFHTRLGSFQKIYVTQLNDGMKGQPMRSEK